MTTASCAAGSCSEDEGEDEEGDGEGEVMAAGAGVCAVALGLWRRYIAPAVTNPNTTTTAPANISTGDLGLAVDAGCSRDA